MGFIAAKLFVICYLLFDSFCLILYRLPIAAKLWPKAKLAALQRLGLGPTKPHIGLICLIFGPTTPHICLI